MRAANCGAPAIFSASVPMMAVMAEENGGAMSELK
jgi:hypothetical protein